MLIEAFEDKWKTLINEKVRFKDDPAVMEKKGHVLISVFYVQVSPARIIGVEIPFSLEIIDHESGYILPCQLVGVFDLIEADDYGNPIVVELKTGNKSLDKAAKSLFAGCPSFELKNEISKLPQMESREDPAIYIRAIDDKRLWGFIAYDQFKTTAANAVRIIKEKNGL